MMSETEDFDELPPITVNSSANDASTFLMPSAQTIASQRAREEACERELRELRARDERLAAHEVARDVMLLAHSDSSGSEGEAALAAAVTALNVAPPRPNPQPSAADVLADVRPHVPPPYEPLCEPGVDLDQVVRHISSLVSLEERWSDEEVCGAGALLCAALVSDTRHKRVAARALHALLDHRATEQQVWGLEHVLLQSWGCARVRMRVSDAARSGAGGGADALADKLLWAALATLLQLPTHELWPPSVEALADAARARWRRVELAARYRTVAAAGRALAALGPAAHPAPRARLLAVLAPPHEHERHRPDRLKVLVGASKLRLLFRSEQ